MIADLPAPEQQRTPEQAREILVHAWRDPRPEILIQASADQPRHVAPASAAGLLALIESLPVHERANHLELYTTRQGRPRAATGTLSRPSLNAERVARWVKTLDLQPGDVLYIALLGWTKWDLHLNTPQT